MTIAWVNLSTRWSLASVQAALNVIISVLSTVGIWSFSRFWWQRGSASVLRDNSNVPLSALVTLSSLGEGWDAVAVLHRRLLAKENRRVLVQLIVVVATTLACMFSGPIAKVSLKSSRTIQASQLEVLQTTKGDGSIANLLEANVLWNDTIRSLNEAGFPQTQMLDYLPSSTAPWTYITSEWNPTWSMTCDYTDATLLHNVTAPGNYTFYDPINAFPAYRDTYDRKWLDRSNYRMQADFTSWTTSSVAPDPPFQDVLFFILIEPDPEKDDRMNTNNETMEISISVVHAQNFHASDYADSTEGAATIWRPTGPVGNTSYARVECNITRKSDVVDEDEIPWIWTNDTYAITMAYWTYWAYLLEDNASKDLPVSMPTPGELLRFYQAYMVSVNTIYAFPMLRNVSILMDTVQLSVIFLTIVTVLSCLTLWLTGRYFWFLGRHHSKLDQVFIPDSKMDWMIHAAKVSAHEDMIDEKGAKDRDHFRTATFGYSETDLEKAGAGLRPPGLARVYTGRTSISGSKPSSTGGSFSGSRSQRGRPPLLFHEENDYGHDGHHDEHNLKRAPSSIGSHNGLELVVSLADNISQPRSREQSLPPDAKMPRPQTSARSSMDGSRPLLNCGASSTKSSFRPIVLEIEEVSPTTDVAEENEEKK